MLRFFGMALVLGILTILFTDVKVIERSCKRTGVVGGSTCQHNIQFDNYDHP